MMGTEVSVTITGGSERLAYECLALGRELEELWSRFRPSSELNRLSGGERLQPDHRTVRLIEVMQRGNRLTNGAFDPSLLREVIELGYAVSLENGQTSFVPAEAPTAATVQDVDLTSTELQFPAGLALDSGGIGKGFAADLVVEHARAVGAAGVLANFGGDLTCWGEPPNGEGWRINVEDPFDKANTLGQVRLTEGAIATSSQLKRRFGSQPGSSEWSHLIYPGSGRPVSSEVQSATVVAGSGWFAEAAAKPAFMWPVAEFLAWAPTVNIAALLVTADRRVHTSPNWKDFS